MNRLQRKQQLLSQGALHRTSALAAKQHLCTRLQPGALVRSALPGIVPGALSLLGGHKGPGAAASSLLPLVAGTVSSLTGRKSLKPAVVGAVVAGGIAALAALNRKKAPEK